MEGLYLGINDSYIEKVSKESEELSLLAKGDGTEVMLQKIQAGRVIIMSPADNSDLMECSYILDGRISYEDNGTTKFLQRGDYFYVKDLRESVYFKTISDTSILYVTTQPLFHMLSNEIIELNALLKKVLEKDCYTLDHNVRLQEYCLGFCEKMHLSKEKFESLFYASIFHDIGKIYTPDEILNKPGRLTKEEFEVIKLHPTDGKRLVENFYLKSIGEIIEQHHERLDGSGYPKGLKEDEILLEAKIIAVIDSFDAMVTDRPYRKGMDPQVAIQELKDLSDRLYDRNIVLIFEEILKDKGVL